MVNMPTSTIEERTNNESLLTVENGNVLVINPSFILMLGRLASYHKGLNLFVDFFDGWNHLEDKFAWSVGNVEMFKSMILNVKTNVVELRDANTIGDDLYVYCDEIINACDSFLEKH